MHLRPLSSHDCMLCFADGCRDVSYAARVECVFEMLA